MKKILDKDKALKIMENELECIKRQDTPKCLRYISGSCRACDLIRPTSELVDAYEGIIAKLKEELAEEEKMDAVNEARMEARLLSEKDASIEGRWYE